MPAIAEVILPLAVKSNFHYRIREDQLAHATIGKRVLVNFGKKKIYTGIIKDLPAEVGEIPIEKLKYIEEILDDEPVLFPMQLRLFEWIAFYYMCSEGEVLKAALPAGLKPESALRIQMREGLAWEEIPELEDKEYLLLEALSIQPVLTFTEVVGIWNILNPMLRLRTMESRGFIQLTQEVEERYKPKFESFLRLSDACMQDEQLKAAFNTLSRAPSQENLLMRIAAGFYQDQVLSKSTLLKELEIGSQVVKELVKKGFVVEDKVQVDRLALYGYQQKPADIVLNPDQVEAMRQIHEHIEARPRKPILLHGVTGSGKTHLYIDLIKEALAEGKQVLYLLPEITLTKQIIDRVKSALGEQVGIYHSRFNDHERVEIWRKVVRREYKVVIGVRSAVFLPFTNLGLIVVDEEHDSSFKQNEPAPRYHARDLAVYYSYLADCPIILGSATPSYETFENAQQGKYHLVELTKRAIAAQLPEIQVVDMRIQRKKKLLTGIFSDILLRELGETLIRGEQAILFQNRRGYSPYLICETCGHVPECINCDISLTFHKEKKHLRCHYCGHTEFNIQACSHCGNYSLNRAGIGTEKIEEQVKEHFPNHQVQRMDLDTTRSKMGYQQIINQFENGQIDILVGTQMVSKGLDFENVTLVGVINADNLLTFPDFRAYERAFQLLTQVSGRAGRSQKKGKVLIQSLMPENIVLKSLQQPYADFVNLEIPQRKQLGYPPASRLLRIELKHKEHRYLEQESLRLYNLLKPYFGPNLLGPDYALIARVRNVYRMHLLIKLNKKLGAKQMRTFVQKMIKHYYENAPTKTLRIVVDVDPS